MTRHGTTIPPDCAHDARALQPEGCGPRTDRPRPPRRGAAAGRAGRARAGLAVGALALTLAALSAAPARGLPQGADGTGESGGSGGSARADAFEPDRQIRWQRSLDDALAQARAEDRRLLIAINADGESASERIVRERYRDPRFVAWTRPFVCVVGSVFRHAPRDVDADGRRVECPRLGAVTCGEHIALEPLVHERFLAGAEIVLDGERVERISPRHAVITADGDKAFDLFLLFDLETIDRELEAAAAEESPRPAPNEPSAPLELTGAARRAALRALAGERTSAGRARLEQLAWQHASEATAAHALADAVLYAGDAGSAHALLPLLDPVGLGRATFVARTAGAAPTLAFELQGLIQVRGLGRPLSAPAGGVDRTEALARLDPEASRTLRLSLAALPSERLAALLRAAAADRPPPPPEAVDDRPAEDEYMARLEALDAELEARPDDPRLVLEHARALLGLARRRIEAGAGSVVFLLQDAGQELDQAAEAFPDDASLGLDRARCAYYLSDFERQERIALEVLALDGLDADTRHEAQRWLGDAGARLVVQRAQGDEQVERAGLERTATALSEVALSAEADATDWISFASFFGATGRPGEQCAAASEGLERFPEADQLRAVYSAGAGWVGDPQALARRYDELADSHPESGPSAWYAGWALVFQAEWQRRGERPDEALATYEQAEERFRRARELRPEFEGSSTHYLGMCALGRGFAQLLAGRQAEAADALVEALSQRPGLDGVRDGLDREALDLVDGALEWRRAGPSPVDGVELARRLIEAVPDTARWAGAVADALLREGTRALGRGDVEAGLAGLRDSIEAARAALAVEDDPVGRRALAQSATTLAEQLLERGMETAEPGPLLAEAARLLEVTPPDAGAPREELQAKAAELRALLGSARPVSRTGR